MSLACRRNLSIFKDSFAWIRVINKRKHSETNLLQCSDYNDVCLSLQFQFYSEYGKRRSFDANRCYTRKRSFFSFFSVNTVLYEFLIHYGFYLQTRLMNQRRVRTTCGVLPPHIYSGSMECLLKV